MHPDKLKHYFWFLIDALIAAVVFNLVFFVMPTIEKYGNSLNPVRVMNVSAEGKTIVTPDIAQTSFSVVSRGQNPESLTEDNNKKITEVIDFVKSQGIDAKDIRTSGYNLSPDYEYDENTRRSYIVGYTLTQTVNLKIRDLSKVAKILGGLTPLGVNQIGGISFGVDNPERFLSEARAEAFAEARAKARDMARKSGVRLGRIVNVSEYPSGPIYPMPYYRDGLGGAGIAEKAALPSIEPGSEELRLQVNITYALE